MQIYFSRAFIVFLSLCIKTWFRVLAIAFPTEVKQELICTSVDILKITSIWSGVAWISSVRTVPGLSVESRVMPSAWEACGCKQKLIYRKVELSKSHCSAPPGKLNALDSIWLFTSNVMSVKRSCSSAVCDAGCCNAVCLSRLQGLESSTKKPDE